MRIEPGSTPPAIGPLGRDLPPRAPLPREAVLDRPDPGPAYLLTISEAGRQALACNT